jgi:N-acetylmuramic acid 6-phosphate (MurNAc-6-P) etherase
MAVFWVAASVIRDLIALMMEAVRTSETLVTSTRLHGATTQKTAIFILTAVRT